MAFKGNLISVLISTLSHYFLTKLIFELVEFVWEELNLYFNESVILSLNELKKEEKTKKKKKGKMKSMINQQKEEQDILPSSSQSNYLSWVIKYSLSILFSNLYSFSRIIWEYGYQVF